MTAETGRVVTLRFPRLPRLQANTRLHWATEAKRINIIRNHAGWATRALREAPMDRVKITATVHPKTAGRFDPPNWAPTVKAAIDGLVDGGLLADDDSTRVVSVAYVPGDRAVDGPRIDLVVTEVA